MNNNIILQTILVNADLYNTILCIGWLVILNVKYVYYIIFSTQLSILTYTRMTYNMVLDYLIILGRVFGKKDTNTIFFYFISFQIKTKIRII